MGLTGSNDAVARRYDRLAPVYRLVELGFGMPQSLRRRAVDALELTPGERVLEVGCGSGRNLPLVLDRIGPAGAVIGTDISEGMLRKAERLVAGHGWRNVTLLRQDAASLDLDEPVDAVLFSLSYSVMPSRRAALAAAWAALRPGGRVVIFDAGSFGAFGRLVAPATRALSRFTVLGDPAVRPWEELALHAGHVDKELRQAGTYVICRGIKPAA